VTKPTISDLLSGVAASLRESVLPEIPPGPVRRQIQAAIAIIRRVSLVCDRTGPYLHADNRDIAETLRRVLTLLERVRMDGGEGDLEVLRQRLRGTLGQSDDSAVAEYPPPTVLAARNLDLQGLLVEVQEFLHDARSSNNAPRLTAAERHEILTMLRALFSRMLEREADVTASAPRK
jgi:hypothetical protein